MPQSEPTATTPAAPPTPVRKGFTPLMVRWSLFLDAHGPKNRTLRFAVDLVPWFVVALALAALYLVSR